MNTDEDRYLYEKTTYQIIGALYEVYNRMGFGYQEKIYQRSFAEELEKQGLKFCRENISKIKYKGKSVGRYFHDFLVEGKIVVELKVGDSFYKNHMRQLLAYLKDGRLRIGILCVFTPDGVLIKRLIN